MHTLWIDRTIAYDGAALRPHWILEQTGLMGDALVAFAGPCEVQQEEMADLVDRRAGATIAAAAMVHFLWEEFSQPDLLLMVHRQRLLAAQAAECLRQLLPDLAGLRRDGDDLYVGDGKLSISVATVSPTSALLHFAVNARQGGAPVPIAALADLGVEARPFAELLLARCRDEQASIAAARATVRAKGERQP